MKIYFKQSLGCVYKKLSTENYKYYDSYSTGETLVSNSEYCTVDQINRGYAIEFVILACLIASTCGVFDRFEKIHRGQISRGQIGIGGTLFLSVVGGFFAMGIINLIIMLFPIVAWLTCILLLLSFVFFLSKNITTPLQVWREYQLKKDTAARKKLQEVQMEITRLRSLDPNLNDALLSLDTITTALND